MASYEDRGTGVRAIVRTPLGGKKTKTFTNRKEAEAWATTEELRKDRGARVVGGRGLTLAAYWPIWQARRLDPTTAAKDLSRWTCHLEPYWGPVPLRKITANGIDAWVADMIRAGELAPATVAAIKFLLSSLLKNAALDGYLDTNPAALTRVPVHVPDSEYRVLTRAEVRRLLAEIPEHYRPLFYLIVQTGLRWAEAAGMRVQDVDLDSTDPGMWVRQTLRRDGSVKATPKNRKARYVPFSDEVVKALRPLVEGRKGAALVFTSAPNRLGPGGNPLDYHNVRRRVFAPAVERAALADPQPTIHDLRHTAATFLAASGIRAHQLRDMLGHRDMRTLDRYLHSGNDDHAEIRRAMSEGAS